MHIFPFCRNLGFGIIGMAIGFSPAAFAAVKVAEAPYSTPFGITLVEVTTGFNANGGGGALSEALYRRLGDADGKPLYTFDKDGTTGKPTCVAECAREFSPYRAQKGAVAFGAWSIVARKDGIRQWAYEGRPLYSYSGDPVPKNAPKKGKVAADAKPQAVSDEVDVDSKASAPKEGWTRAAFSTAAILMPPEFDLKSISTANGYAFIVPATDHILYVFKTAPKDPANWTPAYAAGLAEKIGDFSITVRADGKRQWAYKNQPLYTYDSDYAPDDINGLLAQKDAQIAFAYRNYMPAAMRIENLPLRGPIVVTAQGKTVYVKVRYHNQFGGLENNRGGFKFSYAESKAVGTLGCVDECLKTWKPVVAPANAQSSGFWEIYTRADGTRQWAYKGAALYTYAADKSLGDDRGNNIHEIVYGNGHNEDLVKLAGGDVRSVAGSGFYWHVVPFFN